MGTEVDGCGHREDRRVDVALMKISSVSFASHFRSRVLRLPLGHQCGALAFGCGPWAFSGAVLLFIAVYAESALI